MNSKFIVEYVKYLRVTSVKILLLVVFNLVVIPKHFAQTKIALNDINRLPLGSAVLKNNNYYIPAKSLFFITNASCIWESDQKVLTLFKGEHTINFTAQSTSVLYDGTEIEIKAAPVIEGGQFYIASSIIQDLFSGKVLYNQEHDILNIYLEDKTTRINVSNPLEAIDTISEIDIIDLNDKAINTISIYIVKGKR